MRSRQTAEVVALHYAREALTDRGPRDIDGLTRYVYENPRNLRHTVAIAVARVAAPDNRLYLATLATACMQPVQPRLPECEAVDRLADWATRDRDNGWPSLLLADRARQHGNAEAMLAYLQQAAAQPRFVEYWEAGSLEIWEAVRAMPLDGDDAAKLELAVMYAMSVAVNTKE